MRNDSRSLNGIKNGEQLPRASDPTISGQTSSHEVELGVEGELTSEEWFKSLGHLLDNSTQAKVYLREFEHPDDFKENHREELLRIMRLFVRMMIEHSDGFRIIAYRPIDSTKKEPVEWITQEIARSLDSERTTEVVEKCLAIINSQPAPNSSTVYIIDNVFVVFNRLFENGQRRYYRLDLSYSVLPLFLDVGFTEYFKGTTE